MNELTIFHPLCPRCNGGVFTTAISMDVVAETCPKCLGWVFVDKGKEDELNPGDIVQLNPETVANKMFTGCMMVVTEVKSWGAQGYVQALGENGRPGGHAYYRANHEEMVKVGRAEWVAT